jgi:hypothetical protein
MHSSIAGGGEEVSPEEKAGLGKKLMDATPGLTAAKLAEERFYKVRVIMTTPRRVVKT